MLVSKRRARYSRIPFPVKKCNINETYFCLFSQQTNPIQSNPIQLCLRGLNNTNINDSVAARTNKITLLQNESFHFIGDELFFRWLLMVRVQDKVLDHEQNVEEHADGT